MALEQRFILFKHLLNFFQRLSNLFHGMDENTPVRYTVYCSLIKVAATCNAISFIPTDLDQVQQFIAHTTLLA